MGSASWLRNFSMTMKSMDGLAAGMCGTAMLRRSRVRVYRHTSYAVGKLMRKTSCSLAVLLLLGSAACAHDGILTPGIAPEPASAELAIAPAAAPAQYRISCSSSISADASPLYVVDGVIRSDPADVLAGEIEKIQ